MATTSREAGDSAARYPDFEAAVAAFRADALREWIGAGVPVDEGSAEAFTAALEARLDAFFEQSTLAAFDQHIPSEDEQKALIYTFAWGEWRSLNTFALQLGNTSATDPDHVELRQQLVKQMDDELRHFKLWERALKKLGIDRSTLDTDPNEMAPGLMGSFEYFERTYASDPLFAAVPMQFTDERAPLVFERLVSETDWALEPIREVLELQVPDEVFHVSIGRDAVRRLADRGADTRNRMLDAVTDFMQRFTFPKLVSGRIGAE